jgi:hypothetical protein
MFATMSSMSKPRKKQPAGRQTPVPVSVRMSPAHLDALREAKDRTHRTVSSEILVAIEAHLAALGLWPPPGSSRP